jgi:dihydropteroate synthase
MSPPDPDAPDAPHVPDAPRVPDAPHVPDAPAELAERRLPTPRGVVPGRPDAGGGGATPSFADLGGSAAVEGSGPAMPPRYASTPRPPSTRIGQSIFRWGERTYVMGIVNVTPDSFSGDGLLAASSRRGVDAVVERAVELARRMAADGADLVDVGGESTRPGHDTVKAATEAARVVPVVAAIHQAMPELPISIDTTKPRVAEAALAAGAAMLNDIWGVAPDDGLIRLAAERGVPIVVMHNRAEARYRNVVAEVLADLEAAIERALAAGVPIESIVVDPGFGFGKAPNHNLELLAGLGQLRLLGRPVLLGTSRKSTLGKVLDLPPEERLEATLATTALAIQAGVDIVRVHDVGPNVRVARMADAIVRGRWPGDVRKPEPSGASTTPPGRLAGGAR